MMNGTSKLCCLLLLLISPTFGMPSLHAWKRASLLGCHFGDCSMIVSALRDPRTVLWNSGRYDKAIAHFNTMQELFDENNNIANTYQRRAAQTKRREASPSEYLLLDI